MPKAETVQQRLENNPAVRRLVFDTPEAGRWDTGLLTFLLNIRNYCAGHNITLNRDGLPEGAQKLLELAAAVPEKKMPAKPKSGNHFSSCSVIKPSNSSKAPGNCSPSSAMPSSRFCALRGQAKFRRADLGLILQASSIQAVPIVSLISFLVGLILAFIGAIQLKLFGAQIYVADLVGIAMVRLMAAIMTGIVMAGRTGGAFAAQLGTMQVNQEIDALKTLGISPMEFLVLPRMLALALMMPLLCLYANFMGILGGMVVGVGMLNLTFIEYYHETAQAIGLWNLAIGLFSGFVFGLIVAVSRLHAGHAVRPQRLGRG